jgi:uncharacterized protein YbjT (DUF2867 family)
MKPEGRVVAVAGASGLVGGELVRQLAAEPGVALVRALVRRPFAIDLPRVEVCRVDYRDLEASRSLLRVDQVYCALGTPIRMATPEALVREADHDAMISVARLAREEGARGFAAVSTLQADIASKILFCRIKGEAESALERLGFPSLTIARPSFLWGPRSDFRLPERLGGAVAFLMPAPWRTIHAARLARALIVAAQKEKPGIEILENRALLQLSAFSSST